MKQLPPRDSAPRQKSNVANRKSTSTRSAQSEPAQTPAPKKTSFWLGRLLEKLVPEFLKNAAPIERQPPGRTTAEASVQPAQRKQNLPREGSNNRSKRQGSPRVESKETTPNAKVTVQDSHLVTSCPMVSATDELEFAVKAFQNQQRIALDTEAPVVGWIQLFGSRLVGGQRGIDQPVPLVPFLRNPVSCRRWADLGSLFA